MTTWYKTKDTYYNNRYKAMLLCEKLFGLENNRWKFK